MTQTEALLSKWVSVKSGTVLLCAPLKKAVTHDSAWSTGKCQRTQRLARAATPSECVFHLSRQLLALPNGKQPRSLPCHSCLRHLSLRPTLGAIKYHLAPTAQ